MKNDESKHDAVKRFKIKTEVHRKGRYFFKRFHRQGVHEHGAEPGEYKKVHCIGQGGDQTFYRESHEVSGHNECKAEEANTQFIKGNGGGIVLYYQLLVEYGKEGGKHAGDDAEDDAGAVLCIEMEDKQDACEGEHAEEHLYFIEPAAVNDGVEYGGEKTGEGEADYADGNIGVFDAAVEEYPVKCYEASYAADPQYVADGKFLQFALPAEEDVHGHRGDQHPVPDQHALIEGNEFAEDARKPGEEYGEM